MTEVKGNGAPAPPERAPEVQAVIDRLAVQLGGRTQAEAMAAALCVFCGKPVGELRDEESRGEYRISGLCQTCQDETFGGPEP